MTTTENEKVYLLPGRGNKLSDLGDIITHMGYEFDGKTIATDPPSSFFEKLEIIKNDLAGHDKVIAHSYGAYLLLHSLLEMDEFDGIILLISPLLGSVFLKTGGYKPPRNKKLLREISNGRFANLNLHICIGEKDPSYKLAVEISEILNVNLDVIVNGEHSLKRDVVERILFDFLEFE